MKGYTLQHLPEDLIIQELYLNPSNTIPAFLNFLNQKYNFNEKYQYVYQIIKRNNLWQFITKTKQHESLDNLVQNEELRDILFKYSGYNIKINDLSKIIEEETGQKYTKYSLKRLINYYRLDYITERITKTESDDLSQKQKMKLIIYCNKNNIDINHINYKDLKQLYNIFHYNYIANLMFTMFNKYYKQTI